MRLYGSYLSKDGNALERECSTESIASRGARVNRMSPFHLFNSESGTLLNLATQG